ncbi:MAG TPA: dienelactone hydrolase family protein [Casimicrobiaceae bacterium]|nr:dienelactone hydrolase family protein [Casimicrobiaceae bacterium]
MSATAPVVQQVTFPSLDRDAAGRNIALRAFLILPPSARPAGGYPAVIAMHGCGGVYSLRKGHEDELAERMRIRARLYLDEGFAVLFPDSFRPRSTREVCTVRVGEPTVTSARRRLDALGALEYLAHRGDIAVNRIALVGWSHGGSATLYAINVKDPEVAAFRSLPGAPFFRAAVAFYPGCRAPLKARDRWDPGVPTRIHIGELDDWTPAQPCTDLGKAMAARGADFDVTVYPGSHHAFDAPTGKVVHRDDVPNGVHPGQGVTVGPNPGSRRAANIRVRAFLRDRLAS